VEEELVKEIRSRVPTDGVLCSGPTHAVPFSWLIDRKTVFLPDYQSWGDVQAYLAKYRADLFLLDEQLLFRRPVLFKDSIRWSEQTGMQIAKPLPGLRPVYLSRLRTGFILFATGR
jgi:hypothetical protein